MLLSRFYICIFKHEHCERILNQTLDCDFFCNLTFVKEVPSNLIPILFVCIFVYLHHLWCHRNHQPISRFVFFFALILFMCGKICNHMNLKHSLGFQNYVMKKDNFTQTLLELIKSLYN